MKIISREEGKGKRIICGMGGVFLLVAVVLIIGSLTKASIDKFAIITTVIIFLPTLIVSLFL